MTKFIGEFELLGHSFTRYVLHDPITEVYTGIVTYDPNVINSDFICKNCGMFADEDFIGPSFHNYIIINSKDNEKLTITCTESIIKNLLE
jgi:hypothetical protein